MIELSCPNCGSKDMKRTGDSFECAFCGSRFLLTTTGSAKRHEFDMPEDGVNPVTDEIVQSCIERGIMNDYFSQKEARSVVFDYMDNVRALELKLEDVEKKGRAEGRAEGRKEERGAAVKSLMEKMGWTPQQAKEALGY